MKSDWKDWQKTRAYRRLQELARKPYDLTVADALLRDGRLNSYICRSDFFSLFYAGQRVDDQVLAVLQDLADECGLVGQFAAMRRGAVMNRIEGFDSENRQVLHTACRDLFTDSPAEPKAAAQAREEIEKLRTFLHELEDGTIRNAQGEDFTTMIHIGIGGSDLGPRSVFEALRPYAREGRAVHFISNVDPDDAAAVLKKVDLRRTLVNVVSKSGTTLETLANESLVRQALIEAGLEPGKQCLAVTGKGSPMDNPERYLRSFHMFDYIGGRYSTTSMVGAVMLGFCLGIDQILDFLRGAAAMDCGAENFRLRENLPLLLAMLGVWNHNFLGAPTLAVLPYSQALLRFPAHLQQCDMESNGKSVTRYGTPVACKTGPVLWGEPGTNGQHAFYQLLHQGTELVPVEFIGFRKSQYGEDLEIEGTSSQQKLLANLLAQSVAMAVGQKNPNPNREFSGNRPNSILLGDRLTPASMGALLALYEAKIVFQGFLWNINSFDQEGVQLGKVLAGRFLKNINEQEPKSRSLEAAVLKAVGGGPEGRK
ncbi:MAG: glucose-6-phosphate isomerase [Desulfocapsaceae bacterium]|nr:glucose-6-phosphate isomerase [Desulfocapsaceae bacterium]